MKIGENLVIEILSSKSAKMIQVRLGKEQSD